MRKRKKWNEDTRVKIPATIQFMRLGYDYQPIHEGTIDFDTKIYIERFQKALERINDRVFSWEDTLEVIKQIHTACCNYDLGKKFYRWLTINPDDDVKLIDFQNIENNDFAVVNELSYTIKQNTKEGSFRPDINILVNGIPLAFLEVKKPNNLGGIQAEFQRMVQERLKHKEYYRYFNKLQLITFSNNMEYEEEKADVSEVKAGSFYTTPNGQQTSFSFFREEDELYHTLYPYHEIPDEQIRYVIEDNGYDSAVMDTPEFQTNLSVDQPCNKFITSLFDKERLLYLLRYGMMYVDGDIPQKHIMRYPQFFASRHIVKRLKNGGKNGIIWHTQGSGKTGLAAFCVPILRDYYANQGINTRFFYVVDRLSLLTQVAGEMRNRNLAVTECTDRQDFAFELDRPLASNCLPHSIGEICVVNIQKFMNREDMPRCKNEYEVPVQRIFFIDEAHRSYSSQGSFFRNLMMADLDGVFMALTGTPILTKKERSSLKFGDYVDTYFYDKSIADGYTLRIKREQITTEARQAIQRDMHLKANQSVEDKEAYESADYVNALCKYIDEDFKNFRSVSHDDSVGGMIVCRSNAQARMVHQWFEAYSAIRTGLVITENNNPQQEHDNKQNQLDFKKLGSPDMLVVNLMLTTGYDVPRLKKMYLLRSSHAQSLLQTVCRVNRPYKSPSGRIYHYGYIMDFVDIQKEYDRALAAYVKELEADMDTNGEEATTLDGMVIDKDAIMKRFDACRKEVSQIAETKNIEVFSQQLSMLNKETLYRLRRLLNDMKACETEFLFSRDKAYLDQIPSAHITRLQRAVQDRINYLNLSMAPVETMDEEDGPGLNKIIYTFFKVKTEILALGKFNPEHPSVQRFTKVVRMVQEEVKKNWDKNDPKILALDQLLQDIFTQLNDLPDLAALDGLTNQLQDALRQARDINGENEELAKKYHGRYAFVKTYKDLVAGYPEAAPVAIENTLALICDTIKDQIDSDAFVLQGKDRFRDNLKSKITIPLVKQKLYPTIKSFYDVLLEDVYKNLQHFK